MTFPEYEWGIRCNSEIVDRCSGRFLARGQTSLSQSFGYTLIEFIVVEKPGAS